jgi:hypothetical protein
MLDLSPEELAYVTLVVGKQVAHKDGITAYEKLYDAVINSSGNCLIHMHDLEDEFPELKRRAVSNYNRYS